ATELRAPSQPLGDALGLRGDAPAQDRTVDEIVLEGFFGADRSGAAIGLDVTRVLAARARLQLGRVLRTEPRRQRLDRMARDLPERLEPEPAQRLGRFRSDAEQPLD